MIDLLPSGAWLFVTLMSLAACAVFGAIFHSLRDLSRSALEDMVKSRADLDRTQRLRLIIDDIDGHGAAVALARVVFSIIAAVGATFLATQMSRGLGLAATWGLLLGSVLTTTFVVWLVGTVLPTSIARYLAEPTIYGFAAVVRSLYVVTMPLRAVVAFVDATVRRLSGRESVNEVEQIQSELLDVVEEARQEGQLDAVEQQMIRAVVRFRDTTVRGIMTPRTEMEVLELTNDLGRVTSMIREGGHSRIPVFEGSIDRVVGVFYIKDLLRWLAGVGGSRGGRVFDLRAILRPALFVPESKTIRELLDEMLQKRVHIAIVADEFGGTAGLVTLEDIVEEFFGDMQDEYERPEDVPVAKADVAARAAEFDARAYVSDANRVLHTLGLDVPESPDYDTIGGFVTVTLGRIPQQGETMTLSPAGSLGGTSMLVSILAAEPTRVLRLRIQASDRADAAPAAAQPTPAPAPAPTAAPAAAPVVVRAGASHLLESTPDLASTSRR